MCTLKFTCTECGKHHHDPEEGLCDQCRAIQQADATTPMDCPMTDSEHAIPGVPACFPVFVLGCMCVGGSLMSGISGVMLGLGVGLIITSVLHMFDWLISDLGD